MREQADQKRDSFWFVMLFFCVIGNSSYDTKTLRGMRTRTKKKYVASDRARRENVPRHILFYKSKNLRFSSFLRYFCQLR